MGDPKNEERINRDDIEVLDAVARGIGDFQARLTAAGCAPKVEAAMLRLYVNRFFKAYADDFPKDVRDAMYAEIDVHLNLAGRRPAPQGKPMRVF